jgi:hypothetical protein
MGWTAASGEETTVASPGTRSEAPVAQTSRVIQTAIKPILARMRRHRRAPRLVAGRTLGATRVWCMSELRREVMERRIQVPCHVRTSRRQADLAPLTTAEGVQDARHRAQTGTAVRHQDNAAIEA